MTSLANMDSKTPILHPSSIDFAMFVSALMTKLYPKCRIKSKEQVPQSTTDKPSSFHAFLYKLLQTIALPPQIPYLAIYYMTQLKIRNPKLKLAIGMEKRLIVAALVLAQKMLDDNRWTNKTWAKVSGIPLSELNAMESEIMIRLQFRLHVGRREFERWCFLVNGTRPKPTAQSRVAVATSLQRIPTPPMEPTETSHPRRCSTSLSNSPEYLSHDPHNNGTRVHAPMPCRKRAHQEPEFSPCKRPFTPPQE